MINRQKIIFLIAAFVIFIAACKKDEHQINEGRITPNDFLSADYFDKLIVEIRYIHGFEPTQKTQDNLLAFLNARLHKPAGISVVKGNIPSPGVASYSLDRIEDIESAHRTQYSRGRTLTAFIFFADAGYSGDGSSAKTLGIAYGLTSMVIFEKTIHDYSGGLTQPSRTVLETTVAHHELGHILGLVNNGTPLQSSHQDVAHDRHCNNSNCLMHYVAETSDIVANLLGGNIPQLDAACIEDLRANGGK